MQDSDFPIDTLHKQLRLQSLQQSFPHSSLPLHAPIPPTKHTSLFSFTPPDMKDYARTCAWATNSAYRCSFPFTERFLIGRFPDASFCKILDRFVTEPAQDVVQPFGRDGGFFFNSSFLKRRICIVGQHGACSSRKFLFSPNSRVLRPRLLLALCEATLTISQACTLRFRSKALENLPRQANPIPSHVAKINTLLTKSPRPSLLQYAAVLFPSALALASRTFSVVHWEKSSPAPDTYIPAKTAPQSSGRWR